MALQLVTSGNLIDLSPYVADSSSSTRDFKVGIRYPSSFERGVVDIYAYGLLYGDRADGLAEFWLTDVYEFRGPFSLWEGRPLGGSWRIDIVANLAFGAPCPDQVEIWVDS